MTARIEGVGSFALEEAGLRCLVTLGTGLDGRVEGALSLGHLRFALRGWQDARGALLGFVLDGSDWPVAQWRATLHGQQLRLELRLPEAQATHLTLERGPESLSA